jgi:hypothetical protein
MVAFLAIPWFLKPHFVTSKHLGSQNQSILQNCSIFSKLLKYFVFKQGLSVDGSKKFLKKIAQCRLENNKHMQTHNLNCLSSNVY